MNSIEKRPGGMEDPIGPFKATDVVWAAQRLVQTTSRRAYSAVPLRAQLGVAYLWGWIRGSLPFRSRQLRGCISEVLSDRYDPSEIQNIVERHLRFRDRSYLIRLLSWRHSFKEPDTWSVEGLEHLEEAMARKRGAMLVTAHLGHARLVKPILRSYGYSLRQVYPLKPDHLRRQARLDMWLANGGRYRRKLLGPLFGDAARQDDIVAGLDVRPIFEALRKNEVVSVAGDGGFAAEFLNVPFFGRRYPFPSGYMKIAMITGAPVLPVFVIEKNDTGKIALEIHSELPIDPDAVVADNLEVFAKVVEELMQRVPHQWYRWRKLHSCEPIGGRTAPPPDKDSRTTARRAPSQPRGASSQGGPRSS